MELEGSHTFDAARDRVWELLNDPDVLVRITTGLKQLDPEGDDSYRAIFQIKMGPIDSSFQGTMNVVEKVAPVSYKLLINVDAKIGVVSAKGEIHLQESGPQTLLNFSGRADISGKLAQLGQRVMSGVGKHFTHQFFQSLEKELASSEVTEQEVKS